MKTIKNPKSLDEAFSQVEKELLELFIQKHHDYGKSNILDTKELGILYRIKDKVNRLDNLYKTNGSPKNETVDDNWKDIAIYAIIALLYRRGWFQKLNLSKKG